MPTPSHQMLEHELAGPSVGCANALECATLLERGAACFRDGATGRAYCLPCGERLRYHRKKAIERGETMPETIAAASVRLTPKEQP